MVFSVLFVCTGNICRSPVAEKLFRDRMPAGADVVVSSAGTGGLTGRGIDKPSALALRELGVDPDGHVARRLDADMIFDADLILVAAAQHRGVVLQSAPMMMSRTFTLREFGRLAAAVPVAAKAGVALSGEPCRHSPHPVVPDGDELRARVAQIAGQRGVVDPAAPGEDDIADPFGASTAVARVTVAAVSAAVNAALAALGHG